MRYSLLLLLPLLAAGAPPEPQGGADWRTITPSFIGIIDSAMPNTVIGAGDRTCGGPGNAHVIGEPGMTTIYKDALSRPDRPVYVDTVIQFTKVPSNAYDCQLEVTFARGYKKLNFFGGVPVSFDVWSVETRSRPGVSYNMTQDRAPKPESHVGTVAGTGLPYKPAYRQGVPGNGIPDVTRVSVNRVQCANKLAFRVRVPDEVNLGGVEFRQQTVPFGGWVLRYKC